ncbi:hypothetical protein [Acinetobacter sp. BSP-28]|uniref:hypothetical protein n=1 Tax=Acinetobacter sp. BSP-28 TaxID=3344661 RepID=UPI00376FB9BC
MKTKLYDINFQEANKFLNFKFDDQLTQIKIEDSYYKVQALLKRQNWLNLVGNRFSWLFIRDLIELYPQTFSPMSVVSIINEIEILENVVEYKSLTGEPKILSGQYLKGLKKKHYHQDSLKSLKKNCLDEIKKPTVQEKIREGASELEKLQDKEITIYQALAIIGKNLWTPYIDRLAPEKNVYKKHLTGEWIIYHENEELNYYLALWGHDLDDSIKAQQIKLFCTQEFPELQILKHLD